MKPLVKLKEEKPHESVYENAEKKEKQDKEYDGEMSRLSIGQGPEVETRCDDLPHHQNE